MSKTKPASLAVAFAAKGAAKPVDATKPVAAAVDSPNTKQESSTASSKPADAISETSQNSVSTVPPQNIPMATKSLTVKVDLTTYIKLKAHGGAQGGKTNQDIFVEALELYFQKYNIK